MRRNSHNEFDISFYCLVVCRNTGGFFIKHKIKKMEELKKDIYFDYDRDEDGNLISCCGAILDEDFMICPICGEHN